MKAARLLNKNCTCVTLDSNRIGGDLAEIMKTRPNLFSTTSVYLSGREFEAITKTIKAIEEVIVTPAFRKKALERTGARTLKDWGPKGVFMGFDFHLGEEGPQLIEINTNAGGALLNLELAKAQQKCCDLSEVIKETKETVLSLEANLIEMFRNEWRLQRGDARPGLVVIVDEKPEDQYLYPEFLLFQKLFTNHGLEARITDPSGLSFENGSLWHEGKKVDLVYNRLTDFYFESPAHKALKSAYETGCAVFTPAPFHHALYANKLNLEILTDEKELTAMGISEDVQRDLLSGIPKTFKVRKEESEVLWEKRKNLFFKPTEGFGSRATYRGDKITKRVWDDILNAEYVAQTIVPPSQRVVTVDGKNSDLKVDIRAYVYEGEVQLLAARLYSGQTTNFRTPGGGFAPVFLVKSTPKCQFEDRSPP